ncbi:tRNA (adenosine(37)-N6)-threonylcarbamoyltransferase complex ATPase subunit type 1 TsaE [Candidatus Peregrinibacteria bacterium]|nr:MAG: tRNA (adenosine(37)-N6)-threonylcarbamoyltransferase complex ATPase subunit type 1 TsaE [Candidatus Peregrinibacteria bacterium]
MYFLSTSLKETETIAIKISKNIEVGDNICLTGEMGVGKTTLLSSLLQHRGFQNISSPTFTLAHYYENDNERIVHYDLYRLENQEIFGLEDDLLDPHTTVFIEWSEKLAFRDFNKKSISITKEQEQRIIHFLE